MRDPARIDRIIAKLRAYWHASPDLRLAQIVGNAVGKPGDHYHVEDDVIEAGIPSRPDPAPLVLTEEERRALRVALRIVTRASHGARVEATVADCRLAIAVLDRLLAASPSQPVAPATPRSCSTGEACLIAGGCVPSRCLRADVATPGLTHEELVQACLNIGYDLTCGACAAVFFTGIGHPCDNHTCPQSATPPAGEPMTFVVRQNAHPVLHHYTGEMRVIGINVESDVDMRRLASIDLAVLKLVGGMWTSGIEDGERQFLFNGKHVGAVRELLRREFGIEPAKEGA